MKVYHHTIQKRATIYSIARGYSFVWRKCDSACTPYEGREINQFCMFDVSIVSVKYPGDRDASFRVPLPPPPPSNDIQWESGVDPGARFQRDTQSTMKRSRCCKRSASIGMRVKSQLAAMERRRSVLIQFPGKTLLLKYFTIGGSVLHAWRGKVRAHSLASREPAPTCADRIIPDATSEMQFMRDRRTLDNAYTQWQIFIRKRLLKSYQAMKIEKIDLWTLKIRIRPIDFKLNLIHFVLIGWNLISN